MASVNVSSLLNLAKDYLGTPYHWGGSSPATGFDCSGFVQWLYAKQGVTLPRRTFEQVDVGTPVAQQNLQPGDILFFEPTSEGPGHEGLYIGNGKFIEAPHTGANIRITDLSKRDDYVTARRVIPDGAPSLNQTAAPQVSAASRFVTQVSQQTGIAPQVLNYWAQQEGAYAPHGTGGFNFLNIRPEKGDKFASTSSGNFEQFANVDDAVTATVHRLREPFMQSLMNTVQTGGSPADQWKAITGTKWDVGRYAGSSFDPNTQISYPGPFVTGATGSTGANGGTSDAGPSVNTMGGGLRTIAPPKPSSTVYGPPAPGSGYTPSSYTPPALPQRQDTKNTAPVTKAILNLLQGVGGGGTHPVISAPPVHVAPVTAASASLSQAGLPTTDLSPFTIAPLTPTTAVTPAPTTPNPFQIFGLRP